MTLHGFRGIYNFASPGAMFHNEVLDFYRQYLDPNFTYQNFTPEQQERMSKNCSNCELDVSKLLKDFPQIPHVRQAMKNLFCRMREAV